MGMGIAGVRWQYRGEDFSTATSETPTSDASWQQIAAHPIMATLLQRRGYSPQTAKVFLAPTRADTADPFSMKDMDAACHRLQQALHGKEKIRIYGDYDADGV